MVKSPSAASKYLYSKFRNHVISEQCKSKTEYYQNYFEKHKANMKMLWTGIKSIVNLKAKHQLFHISNLKKDIPGSLWSLQVYAGKVTLLALKDYCVH